MAKTKKNKTTSAKKKEKAPRKPKKPVLGKGLSALLPEIEFDERGFKVSEEDTDKSGGSFAQIDVNRIVYNPYQPRKDFDKEALKDLKNSIIENGILQPITVRRSINGYELIAGERRLRAAIEAEMEKIPAYILEVESDVQLLEMALIENLQREDLNPIETANGYKRLMDECTLNQEQVAVKIGKDRSTITNFIRLLKLPEKIQESVRKQELTMGHARALLSLSEKEYIIAAWIEIIDKKLSVRATEKLVKDILAGKWALENGKLISAKKIVKKEKEKELQELKAILSKHEDKLRQAFGTKVKISTKSKESGKIEFDFYSIDDFDRLIDIFTNIEKNLD